MYSTSLFQIPYHLPMILSGRLFSLEIQASLLLVPAHPTPPTTLEISDLTLMP
jgi:hypothetical protein